MTCDEYDLRSPARLIGRVAGRVPLVDGSVYVVLVARPSTEQRIVAIRRLTTPALIDNHDAAREEISELMQGLPIPPPPAPGYAAVTVVVRRGLCVFGPNEGRWMSAWHYSDHLANAFDAGVLLVTEHGWADFGTDTAGHLPALVA